MATLRDQNLLYEALVRSHGLEWRTTILPRTEDASCYKENVHCCSLIAKYDPHLLKDITGHLGLLFEFTVAFSTHWSEVLAYESEKSHEMVRHQVDKGLMV